MFNIMHVRTLVEECPRRACKMSESSGYNIAFWLACWETSCVSKVLLANWSACSNWFSVVHNSLGSRLLRSLPLVCLARCGDGQMSRESFIIICVDMEACHHARFPRHLVLITTLGLPYISKQPPGNGNAHTDRRETQQTKYARPCEVMINEGHE
jgi:hypothetical protein